jgi:aminoglycoside phosphotransferase (APT) family kinase protein
VSGWTKRYEDAQTDEIAEMPAVAAWLVAHLPPSPAATVIHNDFKLDNVIYDSERFERVVGVLDWEMATVGDPLVDLGVALCYWVEATDSDALKNLSFGPTHVPGMYTRAELAERYADKTGRDLGAIVFYYAFGLFKTAVVIQQIYFRYRQGLTSDPRFAGLIYGVRLLAEAAAAAMARPSL